MNSSYRAHIFDVHSDNARLFYRLVNLHEHVVNSALLDSVFLLLLVLDQLQIQKLAIVQNFYGTFNLPSQGEVLSP